MRGKQGDVSAANTACRITPADAGKTIRPAFLTVSSADHPRGCGENPLKRLRNTAPPGSPPRMRGKQKMSRTRNYATRITPADAGKTPPTAAVQPATRDHPRGCGENHVRINVGLFAAGSPPRMRGKPRSICGNRHTDRITPAGAGKTDRITSEWSEREDHPRRCGENAGVIIHIRKRQGSPPQVRGKLTQCFSYFIVHRITPAGAGKTQVYRAFGRKVEDHPRRCGENGREQAPMRTQQGSPPQVRGKLNCVTTSFPSFRITPADAGKTQIDRAFGPEVEDHPRGCGENAAPRYS